MSDKEQKAIERIQLASKLSLQKYGQPLICTYSGGKDSDVLLELFKRSGVPFEVHNSHTTVDAPETVYHIRKVFKDCEDQGIKAEIIMPKYRGESITMWKLIPLKKFPPTRLQRYCCSVLKETDGKNRMIATGVRWAESVKRRKRKEFEVTGHVSARMAVSSEIILANDNDEKRKFIESCEMKAKTVCNPIIDWQDKEIWEYFYGECKRHNPLYERGYNRVGCIGCPMASKHRYKEFQDYPQYERAYKRAFKKMLDLYKENHKQTAWEDEEDVFRWWIQDKNIKGQINIDEYVKDKAK